ncbi:MAG: hypothetical protein ACRBCK_04745 [Alphaproteobacteria bacterium]
MLLLSVDRYYGHEHLDNLPFLANIAMSDNEEQNNELPPSPRSMGKDWGSGFGSGRTRLFNSPDDFDIVCNREGGTNYIFHGCELNCSIDHMEYDDEKQRITVFTTDGQKMDLGAKIQWLVRPYIAKDQHLYIIRTKDGKALDGVEVHLQMKSLTPEDNPDEKNLN